MNKIAEAAFIDELEKISGKTTFLTHMNIPRLLPHEEKAARAAASIARSAKTETAAASKAPVQKTTFQTHMNTPDFLPHEEKFSRAIHGGHVPEKSGRTQVGSLYVDKP